MRPLQGILLAILLPALAWAQCGEVQTGAIRWDAWHGDAWPVGSHVEQSLGKEQWRNRWPVFFTKTAQGLEFDETLPGVLEMEDGLAHGAGLDYWAFVYYGLSNPMGKVLKRYLELPDMQTRFSLIVEPGRLAGRQGEPLRKELAELLMHPRYLGDEQGRPMLYLLFNTGKTKATEIKQQIAGPVQLLKELSGRPNSGNAPRLVIMAYNPDIASQIAEKLGADIISSYTWQGGKKGGSYAELADGNQKFWARQAASGKKVIPIVVTGWDPRPRTAHPMPWGSSGNAWYETATPEQIAALAGSAMSWLNQQHNTTCNMLIYAWNELDEGGWLVPTVGEGMSRLHALSRSIE